MIVQKEDTFRSSGADVVTYTIASSRDELVAAYRLIHDELVSCDRIAPQPFGLYVDIHLVLPETTTFVAKVGGTVVATMSLIADSPLHLPMDAFLPGTLSELRTRGCRIGEVTALVDRRSLDNRCLPVLLGLSKRLFQYARDNLGLTDLFANVDYAREVLYRKHLGFEAFPCAEACFGANELFRSPLRLSFEHIERECRISARRWQLFSSQSMHDSVFEPKYFMTADDVRYFLVQRSNALAQASSNAIEHLMRTFPALNMQEAVL